MWSTLENSGTHMARRRNNVKCSVVDSEWFFSNPDPTFQLVSNPIWIILLLLMYILLCIPVFYVCILHIMTRYKLFREIFWRKKGILVWCREPSFLAFTVFPPVSAQWFCNVEHFCWKIVKFYQFLEYGSFISNSFRIQSCPIQNDFFRIRIRIRILIKVSDPTGSGSTTLAKCHFLSDFENKHRISQNCGG